MPRLELIANHMNVNMGYNIYKALRDVVKIQQVYMWTDSQAALRWITNPQLSWKQFVSNRVQKINEKGEGMNVKWLDCPTEENHVDIATRECKPSDLGDKWWVGPSRLLDKSKWPDQLDIKPSRLSEEERKQIKEIHLFTVEKPDDNLSRLMQRISYWSVMRITGWLFRFCHNALKKAHQEKLITGPLSTEEVEKVKNAWTLRAQRNIDLTADNMQALGVKKDADGMYRWDGRFAEEYPVFIPRDSELTEPLIRHYHQKCLHGGISMTMSEIRKDFWIPTLRRLSKKIIKQCNICKVFAAKPYDPPATGLLPECRLNVTYGFHTAGVDFIGPFICYKRRQEVKAYLIIITCALTRAV